MSEQIPTQEFPPPQPTEPHQGFIIPKLKVADIIDDRFEIMTKPDELRTQQAFFRGRNRLHIAKTESAILYYSKDLTDNQESVVKLLTKNDELSLARQKREETIAQKMVHANIIPMLASGTHIFENGTQTPYIATKFAKCGTLENQKVNNEYQAIRVIKLLADTALALRHLHENGLVHKDVKPRNILIDDGVAKLCDFGITNVVNQVPHIETEVEERLATLKSQPGGTKDGQIVGTIEYMSPQATTNKPASPDDDIFSWGASAFKGLAKRSAFNPDTSSKSAYDLAPYYGAGMPVDKTNIPSFVPREAVELIYASIEEKPENRPRIDEIIDVRKVA